MDAGNAIPDLSVRILIPSDQGEGSAWYGICLFILYWRISVSFGMGSKKPVHLSLCVCDDSKLRQCDKRFFGESEKQEKVQTNGGKH